MNHHHLKCNIMKKNKSYLLLAAVLTFLFTLPPTHILAQENIIDRLDKSLGVKLPAEYEAKVRDLLKNNNVFKVKGADDCTAQFIENQMKVDWKIDKQNQLVFLWHCIYKQITEEDLYNPEDGDSNRLQDFNDRVVGIRIRAEGQRFKKEIIAYMDKVSEEVKRQSEEVKQRSAEAKQQAAEYRAKTIKSLNESLNLYKDFYLSYKQLPNEEQLSKLKENAQELLPLWKKYDVDYKKTLTPEMLKFYGIE